MAKGKVLKDVVPKDTTALTALQSAWERMAAIRSAASENTNERNRITREANILAVRAMAADMIDPEGCVNGFHTIADGEKPYTDEQKKKSDGTYAKERSQFRALRDAAKRDNGAGLAILLAAWPDGETKNDDGSITYKPTLNRQQFVDIAVRMNSGTVGNLSGEQLRTEIKDEAKAKSAAKRVLNRPEKANKDDLLAALRKLCIAYASTYPDDHGSAEALQLAQALKPTAPPPALKVVA